MTKEQINIAIAESQGWSVFHRNDKGEIKSWKHPDGSIWQEPWVPLRFTEDLNAMHEVEGQIAANLEDLYEFWLRDLTKTSALAIRRSFIGECFDLAHATAAQRAEAYLRTIGKWNEKD